MGGINTQQAIEAALQVGGTGFAELSERMQPSSSHLKRDDVWRDYSAVGFLKRGGGLKAQLLADNALVLGQGSSDTCRGSGSSAAAAGKGKLAMMTQHKAGHDAVGTVSPGARGPMEIEIEIKRSFQRSFQSPNSLMLSATARAAHPHRRHHHRGPGFLVFLGGSPLGYGSQGGGDRWRNGDWTDRRQEPGHGRREDRAGRCAGLR